MIQNPTLSIAGFDNSGGAGLQADLKVFSAFGCYGMSVVTAIAAQNTTGVKHCCMIPLQNISQQLESIFEDIPPKAIKIGMLFNEEIICLISNFLRQNANNIPIVLDPVMISKSNDPLLMPDSILALKEELLPLATVITPNLPEALTLLGDRSNNMSQEELGLTLLDSGIKAVLIKGGHYSDSESTDILFSNLGSTRFSSPRISSKNTHGTGCTLSAAITANLARGLNLIDSISLAKKYISKAIESAALNNVGHGAGPTDHFWFLTNPCNGKL